MGERRLTVLSGDPDPELMCMLSRLVPPDMYRIRQADDPAELHELLRWLDVALVVVDVGMLRRDRKLREHLAFRVRLGLPVIATAEEAVPADEVLARQLGCVLYAPKPLGFWVMHQAVTDVLCAPTGKLLG